MSAGLASKRWRPPPSPWPAAAGRRAASRRRPWSRPGCRRCRIPSVRHRCRRRSPEHGRTAPRTRRRRSGRRWSDGSAHAASGREDTDRASSSSRSRICSGPRIPLRHPLLWDPAPPRCSSPRRDRGTGPRLALGPDAGGTVQVDPGGDVLERFARRDPGEASSCHHPQRRLTRVTTLRRRTSRAPSRALWQSGRSSAPEPRSRRPTAPVGNVLSLVGDHRGPLERQGPDFVRTRDHGLHQAGSMAPMPGYAPYR